MTLLQTLRRAAERTRARVAPAASFRFEASDCLSFSPPSFLGVSQSTRTLFPRWHGLRAQDLATSARRERWAQAVAEAGARVVVLSGFEEGYAEAARQLRARRREIRLLAVWHGSSLQLADETERRHLESLLELARTGVVDRIGFLKQGMDAILGATGIPCHRLMNWVDRIPEAASAPDLRDGETGLGIWFAGASWRKNPYAMLCAASLIPGARIDGVIDGAAQDWCRYLGVPMGQVRSDPLPPERLREALARQHCNLYVTLSECSPLLPLESLSAGAPCLVAPNSHLFEDDAHLADALVVARIDDPHAIADRIRAVVADRREIVAAYGRYALGYNARACELRDRFLEL